MEKANGTMSKITAWGDLKVAGFLRDLKTEEPVQDPAPSRALCRLGFLIILLTGFSVSLVFLFWEAPDVRVKQISNLQGKNKAYPVGKLFNKTNGQTYDPISCPCTKTTIKNIADIMNVYVLYKDSSPEWSIDYNNTSAQSPSINVSALDTTSGIPLAGHVQKDTVPLTVDKFCNFTDLWPPVNASSAVVSQWIAMCRLATTVLFNLDPNLEGSMPLETPFLLNAEALAASVLQSVRGNFVNIQSLIPMDLVNPTATMYGDALMSFLRDVPIDYGVGTDPWDSYYYGALSQSDRLKRLVDFKISNPAVLLFKTIKGIGFLQIYANWTAHYNICKPDYCEETIPMGFVRKLYWALGLLGGTVTIVLGLVNIVLWPFTVFVLRWLFTNQRG